MKSCPVCGVNVEEDVALCERCGFAFAPVFHGDVRDEKLKKTELDVEKYKKNLSRNLNTMALKIQSIDLENSYPEEIEITISEAMNILDIPLRVDISKKMKISEKERGIVIMVGDKIVEADKHFNMLLETPETYIKMGNLLYSMDRVDEALQMYDNAILKNPKHSIGLYNKANLLFSQEKYKVALKCLDKILAIENDNQEAINLRELVSQFIKN
jgi:tetratricopeptide (TPR) repeat protein